MISAPTILLRALRIGLGLALLAYVLVITESWRFGALLLATPRLALALVAWTCMGTLVEARRLGLLLAAHGMTLPLSRGLRLVSIATFFGLFIPGGTGGDVAKLYALASDRPGRRIEVVLIVLVDRAVGLFSLLCLICLMAVLNWPMVRARAVLGTLVAVAAVALVLMTCAGVLAWSSRIRSGALYCVWLDRIPGGGYARRVWDAFYQFRAQRQALAAALALTLAGHTGLCGIFWLTASYVMPAARVGEVCLLSLLGMLANALPITPGGIGVGEAAFTALFAAAGHHGGGQLILAWRIATLLLGVVGALLFVMGKNTSRKGAETQGRADTLVETVARPQE
jgi:uncharacterized protein (TIRG00374 family)